MTEVMEEQWRPEAEEVAEVGLKATTTVDMLPTNGNATIVTSPIISANGDNESSSESDNHSDTSRGSLENKDISGILDFDDANNFNENGNGKTETVHESVGRQVETGESSGIKEEVVEEEIVELEFEKAILKLGTHTMHCPKCDSEVTKVVLRRKVVITRAVVVDPPRDPENIVGCFSCFSLFTCSENGCFNPFNIFGKRVGSSNNPPSQPMVREEGNCLSMFWVFKKDEKNTETEDASETTDVNYGSTTSDRLQTPKYVTGKTSSEKIQKDSTCPHKNAGFFFAGGSESPSSDPLPPSSIPRSPLPEEYEPNGSTSEGGTGGGGGGRKLLQGGVRQPDTAIDVLPEPGFEGGPSVTVSDEIVEGTENYRGPAATEEGSASLEILKSIVYGGLMEIIASFSIVASAAAAKTTALSIVALALASVVGGIFTIGHNLWDLRNDCYKENSKQEATNKYKDLLGRVNNFPLHAVFALLSFLVFGMVPPIVYGLSYRETNDQDYTIVVVAIVSLLCVSLLAVFKAYITTCKGLFEYVKTVVYYVTTAVSVSGVSYVVGILVSRLIEEVGLFDGNSGGVTTVFPRSTTLSLASF